MFVRIAAAFIILTNLTDARDAAAVNWIAEQTYRITAEIRHPDSPLREQSPVGLSVKFLKVCKKLGEDERVDLDSIMVVPDDGTVGASAIPHRLTGDWNDEQEVKVWWRTASSVARRYHVYFDTTARKDWPPPARLGLIGVGDSFLFNDERMNGTSVGEIDWDGDDLPDRVYSHCRVYEHGVEQDEKIGYGTFFYKNHGTAGEQIYNRGIRLKAPNGEYLLDKGYTYFDAKPFDWNADGHTDLIGFRGYDLCIMQNTGKRDRNNIYGFEQPRVLQSLNHVTEFREELSATVTRPSFYINSYVFTDWEADGDLDLVLTQASYHETRSVDPKKGVIPYGSFLAFYELLENRGRLSDGRIDFAPPVVVRDRRGMPLATAYGAAADYTDYDGDGDMDILFGDDASQPHRGSVTMWAENIGDRKNPRFAPQQPVQMVVAKAANRPVRTAKQLHPELSGYSAQSIDWDTDGVLDLLCSDYAKIAFYRNKGSLREPVFEQAITIEADGKPIYLANYLDPQADPPSHWGPQGPGEASIACMAPTAIDWDADGDVDLFVVAQNWNSMYYENIAGRGKMPVFTKGRAVLVDGEPYEFTWRSRLAAGDFDSDGRNEVVTASDSDNLFHRYVPVAHQDDPEFLHLRKLPPLVQDNGQPLGGADTDANNNGDHHLQLADWDADGDFDLFVASLYGVRYHENVGTATEPRFRSHGRIRVEGKELHTFNHAGACDVADWNGDDWLDLVVGAESQSQLLLFDRSLIEGELLTAQLVEVETKDER